MLHTNPGTLIFSGCQIICNLLPCLLGQLSYSTYPQGQSLCWQGLLLLYPPTVPTTHKAITSFPLSFNELLQGKTLSHGLAEPLCLGPSTLTHKRKESGLLAARNTPTPSISPQSQSEPWILTVSGRGRTAQVGRASHSTQEVPHYAVSTQGPRKAPQGKMACPSAPCTP